MVWAFIQLHLSIFLAGWTGLFGKLLSLHAIPLVFWRVLFAGALLWMVVWVKKKLEHSSLQDTLGMFGVGMLLGLHWLFFYWAIKASNVSVALAAFSSVGFFTAFVEAFIEKKRLDGIEVLLASLTMIGIGLIFHFDITHREGIVLALLAAITDAFMAVYLRRYRQRFGVMTIMSWQFTGAIVLMSVMMGLSILYFPVEPMVPSLTDWGLLTIFVVFCTLGMFYLSIQALAKISAFTVNLSYNLEPVYSILLAFWLFHENKEVGPSFYWGMSLIVLSVVLQTWLVVVRHRALERDRK